MKKFIAIILAAILFVGALSACGNTDADNPDTPDKPQSTGDNTDNTDNTDYTGEMVENGNTYADPSYLPVVKEPIKLEAALFDHGVAGDYNERSLWNEIREKTGITVELRLLSSDGDSVALMFASRNYPDISFRIDNATYMQEACENGDILELSDEFLSKYAPNWYSTLEEYTDIDRLSRHSDGKRYGLPQIVMEESSYMLRDLNCINGRWLDELGLDVPTTIDDFTEYLRAVKNAAGTGSIPSNVVPLFLRSWANIGGFFSVFDWFGVYQGLYSEIVVDDTTVVNNAQNKDIMRPVNYLAGLYAEGLINKDFPNVSWDDYHSAIDSERTSTTPWYIGAYFAYSFSNEDIICFAPLKVDDSTPSYARDMGLATRMRADAFFIFTKCKTPIAAIRMVDTYGTKEGMIRMVLGENSTLGKYYIKDDGSYIYTTVQSRTEAGSADGNVSDRLLGLDDYGPGIVGVDTVEQLIRENIGNPLTREYYYYGMYKDYLPADKQMFPTAALAYLTPEEQTEAAKIATNLNSIYKTYLFRWIQGKSSISDDWDSFQSNLEAKGINERNALLQKAWDQYKAATN